MGNTGVCVHNYIELSVLIRHISRTVKFDESAGMTKLTTHILNTMTGLPASSLKIDLYCENSKKERLLASHITNNDGRVDAPLLEGENFKAGTYRLDFHVGDYLEGSSDFLDIIPIRFIISDTNRHHHVPLLLSAYGYSTYRGS